MGAREAKGFRRSGKDGTAFPVPHEFSLLVLPRSARNRYPSSRGAGSPKWDTAYFSGRSLKRRDDQRGRTGEGPFSETIIRESFHMQRRTFFKRLAAAAAASRLPAWA
jgi:hypothetical protein